MSGDGDALPPPPPARVAIDGRVAFAQAVRDAIARAADVQARELLLVDADFADWPLGERAVVASLDRWVGTRRLLRMAACRWDAVPSRHPRWVAWRRVWSHVVDCRQLLELEPADCPTLLVAPGVCTIRMADAFSRRGALDWNNALAVRESQALVDALLQRSEPGFPVTTLGL